MADQQHLEILKQGVDVWNRWRAENSEIRPDLKYARLPGAKLRDVRLYESDLRGADLHGSDLRGANLTHADLNGTNLARAQLVEAHLGEVNFKNTKLQGADLRFSLIGYTLHFQTSI
jgi:uncharacterized protein YjbI with pentapeptide repeats